MNEKPLFPPPGREDDQRGEDVLIWITVVICTVIVGLAAWKALELSSSAIEILRSLPK